MHRSETKHSIADDISIGNDTKRRKDDPILRNLQEIDDSFSLDWLPRDIVRILFSLMYTFGFYDALVFAYLSKRNYSILIQEREEMRLVKMVMTLNMDSFEKGNVIIADSLRCFPQRLDRSD